MLDAKMRIFIGLEIEDRVRERIAEFIGQVSPLAPDVRWVKPESLHITLKFIGEVLDSSVTQVQQTLRDVAHSPIEIAFRGCGFFPAPKSARVFWIGIAAGPDLAELAAKVEHAVVSLGIEKDARAFKPHLTLARSGSGSPRLKREDRPNQKFHLLQEQLQKVAAPEFGTMTAREFFLYGSQLSNQGSRYTKIGQFNLISAGH